MRYLKRYNESNSNDIVKDIEYMFSYIEDYGFEIYIEHEELPGFEADGTNGKENIVISIQRPHEDFIFDLKNESEYLREIKDAITRVFEYLDDWDQSMFCGIMKEMPKFFHLKKLIDAKRSSYMVYKNISLKDDKFYIISDSNLEDRMSFVTDINILFERDIDK